MKKEDIKLRDGYTLEDFFSLTTLGACSQLLQTLGRKVKAMKKDPERQKAVMDCFWDGLKASSFLSQLPKEKPDRIVICPPEKAAITFLDMELSGKGMGPKELMAYGKELQDCLGSAYGGNYDLRISLFQKFMGFLDERYDYSRLVLQGGHGLAIFLYDIIHYGADDRLVWRRNDLIIPFFDRKLRPYINDYPEAPVTGYSNILSQALVERVCCRPEGWEVPPEVARLLGDYGHREMKQHLISAVSAGFKNELPFRWESLDYDIQGNPDFYQFGSDILAAMLKAVPT